MATTATTISLAKICQYLYTVSDYKQSVFFNGTIDPRRNMQLYMERKALEYGNDQSLDDLQGTTNYVYTLLGAQLQRANEILDSGTSGGIVPATPAGTTSLVPYNILYTITAREAGSSTVSNSDWILLQNMSDVVINNITYQYGKDFIFNNLSGLFNFSPSGYVLQEGDELTALAFQQVQNPTGGGSSAVTYPTTIYPIANDTLNVTISALAGKTVTLFLRGGIGSGELITSGTPTGTQVLFTSATGTFTVAAGNEFVIGEQLTVQFY